MLENWLIEVLGPRITNVIIPSQFYLGLMSFSVLMVTLFLRIGKMFKDVD